MDISKLSVQLTANANGFKSTLDESAKQADTFAARVKRKFRADRTEGVTAVERLFGGEELVKQGLEGLIGSGVAVAGIAFAAKGLEDLSNKTVEAAEKFREGKLNAGEFFSSIVEGIPILGSLYKTGENLGKLLLNAFDPLPLKEYGRELQKLHAEAVKATEEIQQAFHDSSKALIGMERANDTALSEGDRQRQEALDKYLEKFEEIQKLLKKASTDGDFQKVFELNEQNDRALALANQMAKDAEFVRDLDKAKADKGTGGNDEFDRIQEAAGKLQDLQKQIEELDATPAQKFSTELKEAGADPAQVEQGRQLADTLDKLEKARDLQRQMADDAKRMWEETRTPLEKYGEELDRVNALERAGKIDAETAKRFTDKAGKDLLHSMDKSDGHEPAQFLAAGSHEAADFLARAQAQQGGDADKNAKLLDAAKTGNTILKTIATAVQQGAALTLAKF